MDTPMVDQLSRQWHSWVATCGRNKRWRHLSVKSPSRWDFPTQVVRPLEDDKEIGQEWKYSDVWSGLILIGRGLNHRERSKDQGKRYIQFWASAQQEENPVAIARWTHLFPYRTQQLSIFTATIVRCAKIASCRVPFFISYLMLW